MQTETAKRLHDALGAAEELRDIAATTTPDRNRVNRLAIERLLVTVGEALNHALQADPTIETTLPDVRRIIGIRSHIVHGYDSIRPEVIWEVAYHHINALIDHIEALLNEASTPEP